MINTPEPHPPKNKCLVNCSVVRVQHPATTPPVSNPPCPRSQTPTTYLQWYSGSSEKAGAVQVRSHWLCEQHTYSQ